MITMTIIVNSKPFTQVECDSYSPLPCMRVNLALGTPKA